MPPGLIQRDGGGAGGMTIGWLLAIALGGGALLFVSLAFILVTLADRRSHRARLQAEHEAALVPPMDSDITATDADSTEQARPTHRRRLTKSPQVTPVRGKRMSLPHILPQIRRNSSIMNLFNGNGSPPPRGEKPKGPHARRKTSWIDEDAIHGPEMQRRASKLLSLRESWLMMRTPTLPTLLGYRDESPEAEVFYRHQNYPLMAPRPAVLGDEKNQSATRERPVSRVPLVRSASYELAQQRAAAAMQFDGEAEEDKAKKEEKLREQKRQDFYDRQKQMQDNVRYGPRPPPAAKLAKTRANTDSNLELILKSTAERLRDGSPGPTIVQKSKHGSRRASNNPNLQVNQATRHRRTPASQESPIKGFRSDRPASSNVVDAYRGVHRTPSPKKMPVQGMATPQSAPATVYDRQQGTASNMAGTIVAQPPQLRLSHHQRNLSTSSMISEADSLFGETVLNACEPPLAAGLSSPSRRPSQNSQSSGAALVDPPPMPQQQQQRRRSMSVPSMRSSVSSALSTVYSEEEPDHDRAMTMNERLQAYRDDHPENRGRRPRQQGHMPKMSDPFLSTGPAPAVPERSPRRLSAIVPELSYYQEASDRAATNAAILGQISGNAQSTASSPVMSSPILGKERDNVRLSILMAPSQELSGDQPSMRPRSVVPMKPTFFATSTSVVSMQADPSTPEDDRRSTRPRTSHGRKPSVVPPPLNLCPIEGSPRFEQGSPQLPTFNLKVQAPPRMVTSESAESLPSSPPVNRPLPDPELMSPTHAYLKRLGFFNESSPSRANSTASARSSQYSETNHGPRDDIRSTSPVRPDGLRFTPSRRGDVGSISMAAGVGGSAKGSSPARMLPLTASIVQLRRMNSQMSTYSAASSVVTDYTSVMPESPTLPELRGGGFSPDRSNSRMNKVGRQNYLNMGTPSPKSRRNGGTRSASQSPSKAAGSGEEKENGGSARGGKKRQREGDDKAMGISRSSGLKGSFRNTDTPKRRLSVRFGEVKEHVYVGEREIESPILPLQTRPAPIEEERRKRPQQRPAGEREPKQQQQQDQKRDPDRTSADSLGLYDKDGFLMSSPDRLPSSAAEGATGRPRSGLRM